MSEGSVLHRLRAELAGRDSLPADALRPPGAVAKSAQPWPGSLAAGGPRAAGGQQDYELVIETIYEGYLLHYLGEGRVVAAADADLALLLGDQLYALGLARLAELGDLEAVAELADVISLVAQAHAAEDRRLADAVWQAGAAAVGWGPSEAHRRAKELARRGHPDAVRTLLAAARRTPANSDR